MKVLHVLYQSLPTKLGTSIRTRDLLRSQRDAGIDVIAVTSPFQEPFQPGATVEYIDGVKTYRTHAKSDHLASDKTSNLFIRIKKTFRLFSFFLTVYKLAKKEKVTHIHAHATFFTGLAAKFASIFTRVPFIYEVRSLWEEGAHVISNQSWSARLQKSIIIYFENLVCNKSDALVVINKNLGERLVGRGVRKTPHVIPNAFYFLPSAINGNALPDRSHRKVFGFIGNINLYEGLEMILDAADALPDCRFLFWGNGKDLESFLQSIDRYPNVEYRGLLSPENIGEAYSVIDCVLNPRFGSDLTNNVTPLKPIEAMGHGKLIIASDIGGMREIIIPMKTGLLFKDRDTSDFIEKIRWAINPDHDADYGQIIADAKKYVLKNRNWANNADSYARIYSSISRN
ncbi:glycosyltransferase family 4 protein [Chitinophaga rhizosphaerae]|uniref:glycosyltransferase family 4 protein n=1 Tax=Chitinophaga rhizosphaerae TaxID=1864947 RepID=UPI000F810B89|nr:glycosyltransferase family 4 protein [Chitinophaga rhizosphaerae]